MEETLEQAQSRHRKEQRDLQSRITQKKKNATKKTRKGVNDECAELERQLKERQDEELRRLTDPDGHQADGEDGENSQPPEPEEPEHQPDPSTNDELSAKLASTTLAEPQEQQRQQPTPSSESANAGGKKRNRQKDRLARRAAEVEALAAAAAEEAGAMTDHRGAEKARMEPVIASNGLVEREVAPDGHCLFAAFADGLSANGKAKVLPYRVVRKVAAGYMADHGDEFAGFLEEPLEEYVAKIRDTAEWGGQLELTALANAYGVEVRVVQDGRTEVIAPAEAGEGERKVVWLAYYRHGYGLGEHYNSLRRKEKESA
ncbi:OTU domain-containing protein 6B [Coniochaeta ligniaria NRRL 30616]|uniref:OTU domain-containing protein 6B n=1 Tax=Coniochaeta ligniaria NRRL 30616 TaxID=1408157 RepID=A0A1J7IMW5_9PEZI|nr:OTU domain-containing protein 6B [Coniochaeta ligniaria NRRL 30616]